MHSLNRHIPILLTIQRVFSLSPAPNWVLCLLVALGLAAALADGIITSSVVLLLYSMVGRTSEIVSSGSLFSRVLGFTTYKSDSQITLSFLILISLAANIALTFTYTMLTANNRYRLSESVRNRLSKQFFDVSYDFILRHDQGRLLNIWNGESWLMGDMYLYTSRLLINICASMVFLILLLLISWKLLIISSAGIILLFTAMHYLSEPARLLGQRMKNEHEKLAERMIVVLHGMRALRMFAQEANYQSAFERASGRVRRTSLAFERLHALVSPFVQIGYLALLAAIVFAGQQLGISFVATLAFAALLYRFQPYVRELQGNLLSIAQLQASVGSVMSMLDRTNKNYIVSGCTRFGGLRRDIRFERVSFTYAGAPLPTLDQISFSVRAGSATAFVGTSGAGKTTIVNLLLRLYRPDSGSILVDGVRLEEIRREDWLSKIAVAGQDVELVEGTVADNLRVARPDADLTAMRGVAETACILEMIEDLPDGFDSWIGQQGLKLSGGQRQRLGLARALLRDPDILILDEATSALNSALEDNILRMIRRKLGGCTLLIITHRLETAMSADQVICIGSGGVLDNASPAELRTRPSSTFWALLEEARAAE